MKKVHPPQKSCQSFLCIFFLSLSHRFNRIWKYNQVLFMVCNHVTDMIIIGKEKFRYLITYYLPNCQESKQKRCVWNFLNHLVLVCKCFSMIFLIVRRQTCACQLIPIFYYSLNCCLRLYCISRVVLQNKILIYNSNKKIIITSMRNNINMYIYFYRA